MMTATHCILCKWFPALTYNKLTDKAIQSSSCCTLPRSSRLQTNVSSFTGYLNSILMLERVIDEMKRLVKKFPGGFEEWAISHPE
jgi:hypothetical protein